MKHYIDCTVCGKITSIYDSTVKTIKGDAPMSSVMLDLSHEVNGEIKSVHGKFTFIGDKMCERVSRFKTGDTVEIAFTPKCRTSLVGGKARHTCYNLGFRIYMARDDEEWPQQ